VGVPARPKKRLWKRGVTGVVDVVPPVLLVDDVVPKRLLGVLSDDDAVDDDTVPNRLRGDGVVTLLLPVSPTALDPVEALFWREKRFLNSSVENAAPVLRTGDECVDDSADVLLSELRVNCSRERRPTRDGRPLAPLVSSSVTELPDDVRE